MFAHHRPSTAPSASVLNVMMELARFVASSRLQAVSESARDEAVRALVNWLGCALGGCLDPEVDAATTAVALADAPAEATLMGRGDRTGVPSAALLGALSAAVLDYGDTHPQLDINVGAAVAGAVFPLAESRASPGAHVLHAFLLGVETACRVALALGTDGADQREDASAICGALGAAVACAKLLGLDETRIMHAIVIAATQASGTGEAEHRGSRSLRLGMAARNGASAALLAERESASSPKDPRGIVHLLGREPQAEAWLQGLGTHWQFAFSAYHAYPCDYALHAAIEACLQLKSRNDLSARGIEAVIVDLAPSRARFTELAEPQSPSDARRSLHHAVAVALLDGVAGTRQFEQARVASARVKQLRARVQAQLDPAMGGDAARVSVRLRDGRCLEAQVRCPLGHPQRPLENADINAKFRALAAETLATDQAERLLALAWNIGALADVGALIRAGVPEDAIEAAELPGSPLLPR